MTIHPFVRGEIACASLANRAAVLRLRDALPACGVADHDEALALVEHYRLYSTGLGWVDVHLLAAARLGGDLLMTLDRPLALAAKKLGVTAFE